MTVTYNVTITNPAATGDGAGFVDAKRLELYGTAGATTQQALDKKRANFRYEHIIDTISMISNVKVLSVETIGASATAEGTAFQMTIEFASERAVYIVRGEMATTGADAIRELIAEVMATDTTHLCDVLEPEASEYRTGDLIVGKMASDSTTAATFVTVTEA